MLTIIKHVIAFKFLKRQRINTLQYFKPAELLENSWYFQTFIKKMGYFIDS